MEPLWLLLARTLVSASGRFQGMSVPCYCFASTWSLNTLTCRLLDNQTQHEIPTPYFTLSDHTLPVTDIVCGAGTFPQCRILTASLDNSCKASITTPYLNVQALILTVYD